MGNKAGVQKCSSHSRCMNKAGGSGVTSCAAERPGQSWPGALRTLSLADGRWKEGARRSGSLARGEGSRRVSSVGGDK